MVSADALDDGNLTIELINNPTMKRSFSLIVLLLAGIFAVAQEKDLLVENFDDESRAWSPRNDEDFVRQVVDGKLVMKNKSKLYHWCGKHLRLKRRLIIRLRRCLISQNSRKEWPEYSGVAMTISKNHTFSL